MLILARTYIFQNLNSTYTSDSNNILRVFLDWPDDVVCIIGTTSASTSESLPIEIKDFLAFGMTAFVFSFVTFSFFRVRVKRIIKIPEINN